MSQRSPLDPNTLAQFMGSEHFYRHSLVREVIYTEGVKYVADAADAYWLLDEIALAQRFEGSVKTEAFQVWELIATPSGSGRLICSDGDGKVAFERRIEWTDFPAPGVRLYFCNGCVHLPSEY